MICSMGRVRNHGLMERDMLVAILKVRNTAMASYSLAMAVTIKENLNKTIFMDKENTSGPIIKYLKAAG